MYEASLSFSLSLYLQVKVSSPKIQELQVMTYILTMNSKYLDNQQEDSKGLAFQTFFEME